MGLNPASTTKAFAVRRLALTKMNWRHNRVCQRGAHYRRGAARVVGEIMRHIDPQQAVQEGYLVLHVKGARFERGTENGVARLGSSRKENDM